MKSVWVLYERTDFNRGNTYDYENYTTSCRTFENFNNAKSAMKNLLRDYATDDQFIFDGEGNIKELIGEIDMYYSDDEDDEEMLEDRANFKYAEALLKKLCLSEISEDDVENIKEFYVTNYMFDAEFKVIDNEITLLMKDDDDGSCNGITPYVHTNMFVMDDENRDYFFYIEDAFKMYSEFTSHLFIDLKKVDIE